jgi:hypothetical protein
VSLCGPEKLAQYRDLVMLALEIEGRMADPDGRVLARLQSLIVGHEERPVGDSYRYNDDMVVEQAVRSLELDGMVYVERRNPRKGPHRGNPIHVLRIHPTYARSSTS